MIENIDDNIGRLTSYLQKWHMEENTLVIFMSDNGTTGNGAGKKTLLGKDGDKNIELYNAGMKGMKGSPHEGGTRVPCFFYWKGSVKAGVVGSQLTAHIDIMPTLLELAGAEVPQNIDGISMVPILENPQVEWPERNLFFHVGRWPNGTNIDKYKYKNCAVRNSRYRLIDGLKLYDIKNDPGQTNDIINQKPEIAAKMKKAYDKWWNEVKPYMVNENVPMSKVRPYHEWFKQQQENDGIPEWAEPQLN